MLHNYSVAKGLIKFTQGLMLADDSIRSNIHKKLSFTVTNPIGLGVWFPRYLFVTEIVFQFFFFLEYMFPCFRKFIWL